MWLPSCSVFLAQQKDAGEVGRTTQRGVFRLGSTCWTFLYEPVKDYAEYVGDGKPDMFVLGENRQENRINTELGLDSGKHPVTLNYSSRPPNRIDHELVHDSQGC